MEDATGEAREPTVLVGPWLLAKAQEISARAHAGQRDHSGAPYGGHISRVAAQAEVIRARHRPGLDRWDVAAAAYLHDALEDSDMTIDDLKDEGVSQTVIEAVIALTHTSHQRRHDYLTQLETNPIALVVKLADTHDNANPQRLIKVAQRDPERAQRLESKYAAARSTLTRALEQ